MFKPEKREKLIKQLITTNEFKQLITTNVFITFELDFQTLVTSQIASHHGIFEFSIIVSHIVS